MEQSNNSECKLFHTISTLETEEECDTFFSEILSPKELNSIVNRWNMMILLNENHTHRYISNTLGVAISTVSRANQLLKKENSFCKKKLIESMQG